jgi:hypothetical protein
MSWSGGPPSAVGPQRHSCGASLLPNPVRLCAEVSDVIVVAAKAFETIAMAPAIALT